tara:strand:- start:381 stop:656 length:276 start_codon:yes stop_codon:yes gene_type:complete
MNKKVHADYYRKAEEELEQGLKNGSIQYNNVWKKALTKARGDEEKAKYLFIELRAEEFQDIDVGNEVENWFKVVKFFIYVGAIYFLIMMFF